MGAIAELIAIAVLWSFYNLYRRQDRMERNASQDVDHPLSIEPAMAKVLAAVHFPRLYVLNRDERNIFGWRENVGFRPSFELDRSPRWSPFPLH